MADNVTINSGSGGATMAADDISGIHHQRVKIQHGADGAATDVSTSSPLPVQPRESDGTSLVNTHDSVAGDAGQLGMLKAQTTDPTSVGDGDAVVPWADLKGRLIVSRYPRELIVQQSTTSTNDGSEQTILTAGAAGVFHDIVKIIIGNTDTGQAGAVAINDASGSRAITVQVPGGENVILDFDPPLKQTTAATAWFMDPVSAGHSSLEVFVQAIKTSA